MKFTRHFPQLINGYTKWVEAELDEEEQKKIFELADKEHKELFMKCISTAKDIVFSIDSLYKDLDAILNVAIALFNAKVKHYHYYLEETARQKSREKVKELIK